MKKVLDTLVHNPVLVAALVQAVLSAAVVFGLSLTPAQTTAILGAVGTVLAFWARAQVTPVASSTGV